MGIITRLSLFKRDGAVYYISYYEDGHQRQKSTRTRVRGEALKLLSDFERFAKRPPATLLLQTFADRVTAFKAAKTKAANAHIYERAFRLLTELTGNLSLAALTLEHIDAYIVKRANGHSPVTVNIEVRALQTAMRLAVKWKLLAESPFAEAKQLEEPDTLPLYLTKVDFDAFLSVISYAWFKELVCFAVGAGLRQGEIVNLTWSQVDFERRLIYIQSNEYFHTKANKKRTVPMSDAVFLLLQRKAQRQQRDLVFTHRGRPISKDYAGHLFKKFLAKTDLNQKLHFHSMRHSYATLLVQSGVPIFSVSKLLGHASVRITERYYAGLSPDNLHDEVNRPNLSFNLN